MIDFSLTRSAATGDTGDPDTSDAQRRIASMIRFGQVKEVDYAKARVRVQIGPMLTAWLPWITGRAGGDRTWWAPEIGEQVACLAQSGNLAQAVVLGAIYQNAFPAPAESASVHTVVYKDGTVISYDRDAHKLMVDCNGDVEITAAQNVTIKAAAIAVSGPVKIDGAVEITGETKIGANVTVSGDVNASGKVMDSAGNSNHHVHP